MYLQQVTITDSWGSQSLGVLPADMRPPRAVAQPVNVQNATSTTASLMVETSGAVRVSNLGGSPVGTQQVSCTASWTVA